MVVITVWHFLAFTLLILILLAIDLLVFHRKAHVVRLREAAAWSAIWLTLGLLFNAGIFFWMGPDKGLEFLTGYLIEKSLSVDNVFVWLVIFSYFSVPAQYQHRVLFYGVLGALVMRGVFIAAGVSLIDTFHWVIYVFGAFLLFTGVRLLRRGEEVHPERNLVVRIAQRFIPFTSSYEGQRFFVRKDGRILATPLFLVLLAVEGTDLVFAVDSVPAILAITRDPFIVWTSNVFAILGLRALFFVVAGALREIHYLHIGLAGILVFVGAKMLLSDVYKVPTVASLGIVVGILALTIAASYIHYRLHRASQSQHVSHK